MVFIGNADSADGTRNFFLIGREVFAGHERFEVRVDLVLSEKVLSNADTFLGQAFVVIYGRNKTFVGDFSFQTMG